MPRLLPLAVLLAALPARAAAPLEEAIFELEDGPFYVLNNDQTFGVHGTPFEADDLNQQDNLFYAARFTLEIRPWKRHGVALLWAPLPIETRARLARAIRFRDTLFTTGTPVESLYDFEGYRGTYYFRPIAVDGFEWDIGAAVQIRNAIVSLAAQDGSAYAQRSDIGFVPALATRLRWWPAPTYWLQLEATGLSTFGAGGTKGSLYDVAASLGFPLDDDDDASLFVRTRLYGGGVELEDGSLDNQAAFLFLTAGVRADLVGLIGRL